MTQVVKIHPKEDKNVLNLKNSDDLLNIRHYNTVESRYLARR